MSGYYDIHGQPISATEWASERSEDADSDWSKARRQTKVEDSSVSTVHLGLDHQCGEGRPLIFESMIFGGGPDQTQVRYSTMVEAHAGHARLVEQVRLEAHTFRALAADPEIAAAARLINDRLTHHSKHFDIYDYDGRAYQRLVAALMPADVTS